jgi:osmoprotectant transport system permease protein
VTAIAASGPVIPNFGGGGANSCVRQNKAFCWDWFSSHWGSTFQPALVQHIVLTVIAVGIGMVIALGVALVAHRYRWVETPFTVFSGFLYTIPSLALFQLLVPITGLTTTTAEIALVSYTLLILFRNTLTGLRAVPPEAKDAAEGMGLSRRQMLMRIELPLALPAIFAGIRVATVTTISLATVAAFITPLGLGAPIFSAIQTGANTDFVAAGLLAIVLALLADALIVLLQRLLSPWQRARGRSA